VIWVGGRDGGCDDRVASGGPEDTGMLVKISDNRHIDTWMHGSGLPTIVLPKNVAHLKALSGTMPGSFFIYEAAGSGRSASAPLPRTAGRVVDDVQEALKNLELRPPYIAVGYSATAFEALIFAYRNQRHTRGLILVDPSIPFMDKDLYQWSPRLHAQEEAGRRRLTAALAAVESELAKGRADDRALKEDIAKLLCQLSEWDNLHTASSHEVMAILSECTALNMMPVLVLSAGRFDVEDSCKEKIREKWHTGHAAYAKLSSNGEHRILADCDHASIADQRDILAAAMNHLIESNC
jgi:pimeloyl-ACP methyl ester carboxylesterase